MKRLDNKFQALLQRMQSEDAGKAFDALLNATPKELTEAYRHGITPRTSVTSPLRIDAVRLEHGNAAIGMTLCPGKKGPSNYGGPWLRDLGTDMAALKDWGSVALLTVMEPWELTSFHVQNIGDIAASMEITWYYIPITDGDLPDVRFDTMWPTVGRELFNTLKNGNRIVIHCRGGLGRTGTIACLLLVELGHSPSDALQLVRRARPGAVETTAQEQFIREYKLQFI